eukprot:g2505.t1
MQQLLRFGAWSQGFQRRSCRPRGGWDQPLAHYFERPGKPGDLLPPLVVLHGFSGDSRIMVATKMLAKVDLSRRIILIDLPGHGENVFATVAQARACGMVAMAERVAGMIDAVLGAGARFDLIGHSLGGAQALHALARFPGRIRRCVLFAPAMWDLLTGGLQSVMNDTHESVTPGGFWDPPSPDAMIANQRLIADTATSAPGAEWSPTNRTPPFLTRVLWTMRQRARAPDGYWETMARSLFRRENPTTEGLLEPVVGQLTDSGTTKVLVVIGDRDTLVDTAKCRERLGHALGPLMRLVLLEDCGHSAGPRDKSFKHGAVMQAQVHIATFVDANDARDATRAAPGDEPAVKKTKTAAKAAPAKKTEKPANKAEQTAVKRATKVLVPPPRRKAAAKAAPAKKTEKPANKAEQTAVKRATKVLVPPPRLHGAPLELAVGEHVVVRPKVFDNETIHAREEWIDEEYYEKAVAWFEQRFEAHRSIGLCNARCEALQYPYLKLTLVSGPTKPQLFPGATYTDTLRDPDEDGNYLVTGSQGPLLVSSTVYGHGV